MVEREDIELARAVDLPAFLESVLGLVPAKGRYGAEMFYYSPFREERTSSLHVSRNGEIWVWFDHGFVEKTGGDAIALLRKLGYSFRDAVEKLARFNGGYGITLPGEARSQNGPRPTSRQTVGMQQVMIEKLKKIQYVRRFYERLQEHEGTVKKYFAARGLNYHPDIGCRVYVDFKNSTRYMVFPIPSLKEIRGVERREIVPVEREVATDPELKPDRKSLGIGTLWVYKRDTDRVLVTESILDALAGEIVLNEPDITLVSLNGVGQVRELEALIKCLHPKEALVALDKDGVGREAEGIACEVFNNHSVRVKKPAFSEKDLFREYLLKHMDIACCK